MGCTPTTLRVKPSDSYSRSTPSNSNKLPPEVLEGFGKVLRCIAAPVTKPNPVPKPESSQEKLNIPVPNDPPLVLTVVKVEEEKSPTKQTVLEQNVRRTNEKLPPIAVELKSPDKIAVEHKRKIIEKSEFIIGDVKKASDSEVENDPREEMNTSKDKRVEKHREETILHVKKTRGEVMSFGNAEEEVQDIRHSGK